jgi:uncharacterized protein YPO0396
VINKKTMSAKELLDSSKKKKVKRVDEAVEDHFYIHEQIESLRKGRTKIKISEMTEYLEEDPD